MHAHGFVDIEWDQVEQMVQAVDKKRGICKIPPAGRFSIRPEGLIYNGLACSNKMDGEQTGVGAEYCRNCTIKGHPSE